MPEYDSFTHFIQHFCDSEKKFGNGWADNKSHHIPIYSLKSLLSMRIRCLEFSGHYILKFRLHKALFPCVAHLDNKFHPTQQQNTRMSIKGNIQRTHGLGLTGAMRGHKIGDRNMAMLHIYSQILQILGSENQKPPCQLDSSPL
jgi:hypothetical protein